MATGTSFCSNCGATIKAGTAFCANCGAKLTFQTVSQTPSPQRQVPPAYYPPTPQPQQQVSTGPYKAIIGVLLLIIMLLGIGLYATSAGHITLPFGTYRYSLSNPPNAQSIVPPNTGTPMSSTTIWNACGGASGSGCPMSPNGWREGGVPDTYDYFVSFTSDIPITVYFFTLGQFVQYSVCNGDLSCVSGSYYSIAASTSQQRNPFKLAEGCGDYVAIFVASATGTMYPNVSVAQNPASTPTGYCAQAGSG